VRPTVLIVDDHAQFRQSAGALLEAEGFAVIAEAADGNEAIAAVERARPQIVLLDVQLPDVDGFTVAERLAAGPDPPVVVLISAVRPRLMARGFRRPPRVDPFRSASCRARRLPRSSADRRMRSLRVLLWPAGVLFGLGAEWVSFGWDDPRHWIPDLATGRTRCSPC
jgi:CheY-like chemotaxis protein